MQTKDTKQESVRANVVLFSASRRYLSVLAGVFIIYMLCLIINHIS